MKILEGTEASVPPQGGRKHPQQEFFHINTTNILFICGGAFDGLDKIISSRIDKNPSGLMRTYQIRPSRMSVSCLNRHCHRIL